MDPQIVQEVVRKTRPADSNSFCAHQRLIDEIPPEAGGSQEKCGALNVGLSLTIPTDA